VVSQQHMLAKATEALLDAVKATGEGPSEFALYLLELIEVSAKINELSDVKAAAKQTAVSNEAKKWQELSLLTLQFCADGLNEQQKKLARQVTDMAGKGASLSRSAATAIAGGPAPALTSVSSMLAALPRMPDLETQSKAQMPMPAMAPPPRPKPTPQSGQKSAQVLQASQTKPPAAAGAADSPAKSVAKGKAKAKQQVSKQAKQAAKRTAAQQPVGSQQLSTAAPEFHPDSATTQACAAAAASRLPNFDCYDDEE